MEQNLYKFLSEYMENNTHLLPQKVKWSIYCAKGYYMYIIFPILLTCRPVSQRSAHTHVKVEMQQFDKQR